MKSIFTVLATLSLALAAISPSSSQAQVGWWQVNAQVAVTPTTAAAVVQNVWFAPLACQGSVYATTYRGWSGWVNVAVGPVYPGTFGYAYLTASPYDPFVYGQASIYCRYW